MKKITLLALAIALSFGLIGLNKNDPTISFLESLNNEQLSMLMMPLDDTSRNFWHYLPAKMLPRTGLIIDELNGSQKEKFSQMLQSFLSESGYDKTREIIDLENVLIELGGDPEFRDDGAYYIAVYGDPRTDSLWAWSFEGHHVSLNFTISNGKISTTPRFFGANPATITEGSRKGERVLQREEDGAFELLNSLSNQQKKVAIFQNASFEDIVTTNAIEVGPLRPVGIKATKLNAEQKNILKQLISEYLSSIPQPLALKREKKINDEEFDEIRFGWAGSLIKGKGHYYRIQGKSFLIEFDNTQNNANHIHTVWRDFDGDFGRDMIREHYLNSNHHNKKE
ncbi:DUF3500 domain-containing protein [Psychroflexus sp. CAK1W]|uniref:DUF3500 domain-containing protein n=1 Tax=Psychroflexus curvus TaxID=2873595 RepID=UPI001CC8F0B7|nr:DUF3500 domain-containing protein [Psychroflexus curvus]MBZ9626587.1 DUF3500 domain-containing protein [Psychroflexus curvus]